MHNIERTIWIGSLLAVFVGSSFLFSPTINVTLVKTWDSSENQQIDGKASIGNGLYNAIMECDEHQGVTSIERNRKAILACLAYDTTYYQYGFSWKPFDL